MSQVEFRFARVGGKALFSARTTQRGYELWSTNGSTNGTVRVKEFMPGTTDGLRDIIGSTDTYALVVANDEIFGRSIWATDGTLAGTRFLMQEQGINTSQEIIAARLSSTRMVFTQDRRNSLWVTDGTPAGTRRIRQFPQCADGSAFGHIRQLTGVRGKGYALFSGCTLALGHELWRTNGTSNGTYMVRNINFGLQSAYPRDFYQFDNRVVFSAESDQHGRELWVTNGTKNTTRLIKDIVSGVQGTDPTAFRRFGNRLYFAAKDNSTFPRLFKSDFTSSGTSRIGNVFVRSEFANIGTKLVFAGNFGNSAKGTELMSTKGTLATTKLLKDIYPGFGSSKPIGFTAVRVANAGFVTPKACPDQ